jgi:hypothetical protein
LMRGAANGGSEPELIVYCRAANGRFAGLVERKRQTLLRR